VSDPVFTFTFHSSEGPAGPTYGVRCGPHDLNLSNESAPAIATDKRDGRETDDRLSDPVDDRGAVSFEVAACREAAERRHSIPPGAVEPVHAQHPRKA
jgi:hypothetical protein